MFDYEELAQAIECRASPSKKLALRITNLFYDNDRDMANMVERGNFRPDRNMSDALMLLHDMRSLSVNMSTKDKWDANITAARWSARSTDCATAELAVLAAIVRCRFGRNDAI